MNKNIIIAKEIIKMAKSLISSNFVEETFQLSDRTEQFKINKETNILSSSYVEFSIDFDKVLDYHQDFQGYLSSNRYTEIVKSEFSNILKSCLLMNEFDGQFDFKYTNFDLFEERLCVSNLELICNNKDEFNKMIDILDDYYLINADEESSTTWKIWSLDMWGNEQGGFEVNDRRVRGIFECDSDDKKDIQKAFEDYMNGASGVKYDWDGYDGNAFYVIDAKTEKKLFQVEKE